MGTDTPEEMSAIEKEPGRYEARQAEAEKERVREAISAGAAFDVPYVVMNVLATVIACYGLFSNSPAVVIGAMIIAMVLGPILGVALSLVDLDNPLLEKAIIAEIGGVVVVLMTAFVLGRIHMDIPITEEIISRTAPNLLDLMIALGGGAAGAYAMISPRLSVAFVGVAIATALVPPLSSCGILLARGEYRLAGGAFLLAFTNIIGIQIAASFVMWLGGYGRIAQKSTFGRRVVLRHSVSILILIVLGVVLTINLRQDVSKQLFESNVRRTLSRALVLYPGSYLDDVRFGTGLDRTIVRAVVRGPALFSAQQVAAMEDKLRNAPNGSRPELHVRFIPTTVITRQGLLYGPDSDTVTDNTNAD